MHFYLFARCKTPGCSAKTYLAHEEVPTENQVFFDYPDEWFPVTLQCGLCKQTHSYEGKEIGSEISSTSTHPPEWSPIFDVLPRKPEDKN